MIRPDTLLLQFRLRHGLGRSRMAGLLGISERRLAAHERGEVEPEPRLRKRVLDLARQMPSDLVLALSKAVTGCGLPRALSRTSRINLRCLSGPAIRKRPSIVNWVGEDLAPIASGVLEEMLGDGDLQRAIARGEVVRVVSTTQSVLRTAESEQVGAFRTTINYCFHDGVLFSDAIGVPVSSEERIGYTPVHAEEAFCDLFGDGDTLAAALSSRSRPVSFASGRD